MTITFKRIACASVGALAILAVAEAATSKYYDRQAAIRKEAAAELQKLGLSREAAKAKYPTPEIQMVSGGCLAPGGTGEIVVRGKFAPGTKFVLQSDALEIVKDSLTATEYRATVKVAPEYPPHSAGVVAISPVSGISSFSSPGVSVGGKMEWIMEAGNGWKVVARSPADRKCAQGDHQDPYQVQFFRKGETAPFQTRSAKGSFTASNATESFTIEGEDPLGGQTQNLQTLMAKMGDPKLSNAEREKLMAELEKMQTSMMASVQNATKLAADAEAKRKTFGCERIEVKLEGANLTGTMRCSESVGTRIQLTGTVKNLGQ